MKKIINGKLYNTDTAEKISSWENSAYPNDFNYFCETLYRKRTGEFFLYGQGNAASKYSRSLGQNQWASGEAITPLSVDTARQWAEEHIAVDKFEAAFGAVSEEGSDYLGFTLSAEEAGKFRRAAQERGITLAALLREFIETL